MPISNPYRGEAHVQIGGKTCTLCFTFDAFARLKARFGDMDLQKPLREMDFPKIADILEIGLAKHHPEITAATLMQETVPLMPAIEAIHLALHYSLTGGQPPAETEAKSPPAPAARKKTA